MMDVGVHLRRIKDNVEVITIEDERIPPRMRNSKYATAQSKFIPVRYVSTGRKGYIQKSSLESDFAVIGKAVDPDKRWEKSVRVAMGPTAAAMAVLREVDIARKRDQILNGPLQGYEASQAAKTALESAIHMILAGI